MIDASNPDYRTAHISGRKFHFGEPTFGNIIADVDFFNASNALSPTEASETAINLITQW